MGLASAADRVLAWLKWPAALASLVLLPGLVDALGRVLGKIARDPTPSYAFLAGAAGFAILWRILLRRAAAGRFFMVFEHELTHALFAWATFHRVVGFRATVRSGGHVQIVGRGNWLITSAPYFFPTASLIAIAILTWLPPRTLIYGNLALGATVAYHLLSTFAETHRDQPDLRRVGWVFSALFLPGANVVALGIILGVAAGLHPFAHLADVPETTRAFYRAVLSVAAPRG